MTLNLQQLKELQSQITPGPWAAQVDYDDGTSRGDGSTTIHDNNRNYLGIMHGDNAILAALAPELLAEVIRIREKLEELKEEVRMMGENCYVNGQYVAASGHARTVQALTRILNGDTNE